MKAMTDQELDRLFEQSAQHQQVVEQINRQVMKTVRRDMRLKVLRKWARLIGLCFGLPVLIVLFAYALYTYMPAMDTPIRIISMVLPISTLALFFGKNLHDFSPADL